MENLLNIALDKMLTDTRIITRNEVIDEIRRFVESEVMLCTDEKDLEKRIVKKLDDLKEIRTLFRYGE